MGIRNPFELMNGWAAFLCRNSFRANKKRRGVVHRLSTD